MNVVHLNSKKNKFDSEMVCHPMLLNIFCHCSSQGAPSFGIRFVMSADIILKIY